MKMTALLCLAFAAAFAPASPAGDANDTGTPPDPACPPEHRNAPLRIGNLLESPLLPQMRARFDLGTASVEDVRLLSNPADREACARLWEALETNDAALDPSDAATFYQSGNRYFVPVARRVPAGVVRLDGASSLHVYDADSG